MKYYPVNLDMNGRDCLVVGGGGVGTRKVATLLECGARITVVSHGFTEKLKCLASEDNRLTLREMDYSIEDLDGRFLVFAATDDRALNLKISRDAEERNILCNAADLPEGSKFILPSVVSRGDLTISISTSGASPAFARQIGKELRRQFGPEYAEFLQIMGAVRKKLLAESRAPDAHKIMFEKLLEGGLLELTKNKDTEKIDLLLQGIFGGDYNLKDLIYCGKIDGSGKR